MTRLHQLEGAVVYRGAAQRDPRTDCYLLGELVVKDGRGQVVRLTDVVVPGRAFSMLTSGGKCQIQVLHLTYPKPLGTFERAFLVKVHSDVGFADGAEDIRKWVTSSKGAAFHYLWYGLILLPAFGFGLLLWACALRLIALEVPPLAQGPKAKS